MPINLTTYMRWKHFWKDKNYQSSLRKIDILESSVSMKDNEHWLKVLTQRTFHR